MLRASDLLKLTWDELKDIAREEIQLGLGNNGPWEHHKIWPRGLPRCSNELCSRCHKRAEDGTPCPVPPPITLEPVDNALITPEKG